MSDGFVLDKVLENDSFFVKRLRLCEVRVINDSRFVWLLLVPMRKDLVEMHDLGEEDRLLVMEEMMQMSELVKKLDGVEKINVAAIGNIVEQLHIHVIGRSKTDPVWPKPVWGSQQSCNPGSAKGSGPLVPYTDDEKRVLLQMLK